MREVLLILAAHILAGSAWRWKEIEPEGTWAPNAVDAAQATYVGESILLTGGMSSSGVKQTQIAWFDWEERRWENRNMTLNHARAGHTTTRWSNDTVVVWGGAVDDSATLELVNVSDHSVVELVPLADSPSPRSFHSAVKFGAMIVIFGGQTMASPEGTNELLVLSGANDSTPWTWKFPTLAPANESISQSAGVVRPGRRMDHAVAGWVASDGTFSMIIFGGESGHSVYADAFRLHGYLNSTRNWRWELLPLLGPTLPQTGGAFGRIGLDLVVAGGVMQHRDAQGGVMVIGSHTRTLTVPPVEGTAPAARYRAAGAAVPRRKHRGRPGNDTVSPNDNCCAMLLEHDDGDDCEWDFVVIGGRSPSSSETSRAVWLLEDIGQDNSDADIEVLIILVLAMITTGLVLFFAIWAPCPRSCRRRTGEHEVREI